MPTTTYLSYEATRYFSTLVNNYLKDDASLKPFYAYAPSAAGLKSAMEARSSFKVDRAALVEVLKQQYQYLSPQTKVQANLELLLQENTFSICTAHQPNLGTGYLYFIYKILHVIKLADDLKQEYPSQNFVPVYYMGSEDNDLDELGTFRYGDKKFVWDAAGQTGAVGRMSTESLKPLLDELFALLGPPGPNLDTLKDMLTHAYLRHNTIAEATQYLTHELFGRYGLIVLQPDVAVLKRAFIPVMENDLLEHAAFKIVSETIEQLEDAGYKGQAHPRMTNLFYLKDNIRERIEQVGEEWRVLNTDIVWNKDELLAELNAYPERFSPNVILRGLYQETILPNIAFIGGGSEVAYWLQLRGLFDHYKVFYPSIHLRQSVLWTSKKAHQLREKLGWSVEDLFAPEGDLIRRLVSRDSSDDWQTGGEAIIFEKTLQQLKLKAQSIDVTLKASAEAVFTKIKHQLQVLEKKMLRAEKRKLHTELEQLTALKEMIFPAGTLQERRDNFMPHFLQHGFTFFDLLLDYIHPLQPEFLVIEE